MPRNIAIIGYTLFVLLGVYRLFRAEDMMDAGSAFGIALIFDPFAPVTWAARPLWQRAWLVVHLTIVFGLIGYGWFAG